MEAPQGITLAFLHEFITTHGGRDAFYGLTTEQVCHQIILPDTAATKLSYMEHYLLDGNPDFVAPATWYVSHTWQYYFLDVVDSLELFLTQQGITASASLWFCVFVNNQHLIDTTSFSFWSKRFQSTLEILKNMVVIPDWHQPLILRRAWCIYELYMAAITGAHVEVAVPKSQLKAFLHNPLGFSEKMGSMSSKDSTASVLADQEQIHSNIEQYMGFANLDRILCNVLRNSSVRRLKQLEVYQYNNSILV